MLRVLSKVYVKNKKSIKIREGLIEQNRSLRSNKIEHAMAFWHTKKKTLREYHDNSVYDHNNEVLEYTNEFRMLYIRANFGVSGIQKTGRRLSILEHPPPVGRR